MINAVDTDDAVVVSGRIPSLFPDTFGCACEKTRMEKKKKSCNQHRISPIFYFLLDLKHLFFSKVIKRNKWCF